MSREDLTPLGDRINAPEGDFERFEDDMTFPVTKDTAEVEQALRERYGPNARIAATSHKPTEDNHGLRKWHYIVFVKRSK